MSTAISATPRLPPGSVRKALHAHAALSINWLTGCNWVTMMLMSLTISLMLPSQQNLAWQWATAGSAYTLIFLLVRHHNAAASYQVLERIYALSVCGFSLLWVAIPVLFFDPENFAFSMFMLTIFGGLAAASVPILSASLPLYWLWITPPFLAQISLYWLRGGGPYYWGIGFGMMILLISQLVFARNHHKSIIASIRLGLQNTLLVQQLEEKTALAVSANMAKTRFLAAASHDLRQPVYALSLFLDALASSDLNTRQVTMVQHASAANLAASEMLQTLLDFSRIEAGVLNPQQRRMDLMSILNKLGEEFGPQAYKKKLLYRTRSSDIWIESDPQLIALVLRNLVNNALRYTQSGGVLVAARRRQQHVMLQVWDTGIGIPIDKHQEIFREFHQLGNVERDHRKGLGMGLAIAEGLARSMGASIEVASRPGKGSVFSLVLPLQGMRKTERHANPDDQACVDTEPDCLLLQGIAVLVVDDDEAVRAGLHAVLQSWGCHVSLAEGMQDALAKTAEKLPDVLLTDYRLRGGVTGGDIIRAVRQAISHNTPDKKLVLPAIIVTGDTHPERLREAQGHAALLLHKPLAAGALKAALVQALASDASA
ncbi:hybrid sensor histidine kinase/response regulator [Undibacterium sp. CY18W]|uniref:histidine kinase n=1 Tax=Undibacterium hunanense TaxID=2762292 RepID=A0ABR6ZSI0_9BURK|nr:hybrid sensor histidine kinase/response regulator [Undibacterium hunanense]MBC3918830.1 hybrid sensor histidine kinase/response regulator [Undibacterium hunanense]